MQHWKEIPVNTYLQLAYYFLCTGIILPFFQSLGKTSSLVKVWNISKSSLVNLS